ncbi:transketolase/ N-terminal domain-like protein [Synechococcus sp. A15-127]|uniref:transketolase n=1 Tax=Synechococcus sp. A15-127 TaxID=1050624 RepID=UPI001645626D|nr:transketolase [Synechococcus sp. A15-127]QNI95438.1 transketolase/ N-terminal domain-like protein [Synechococcus sp. A15-127]
MAITAPVSTTALSRIALTIRQRTIETSARARIPHLGSCLSCVELLTALYWQELRIDPQAPDALDRDRFVLSKGHGAPVLFQILAERGFFEIDRLSEFGKPGSVFHEHPPKPGYIPGVEAATGSLGHGLPMALGMAIALRIQGSKSRCYALLSDGECNEGSIWEAAMLAAGQHVHQLTAIVDYNKWQATGRSQEVMALEPLADKWEAFGWHVQEIDGHDLSAIGQALTTARAETSKPSVIVAHTIKGKGVSFMEDDNNWHYRTPNPEELAAALAELQEVQL